MVMFCPRVQGGLPCSWPTAELLPIFPAPDVVSRSVCQPRMLAQPKQNPPLIPWLYHPPRSLPPCASQDEIALITSLPSRGGALSSPRGRGQGSASSTGTAPRRRAVPLRPRRTRSRSHAPRRGQAHPDRRRSHDQHVPRSAHSHQFRLTSSCTKITDTRWEPTFRVWLISVVNGSTSVMRSSLTVCLARTSAGRDLSIAQSTRSIGVDCAIGRLGYTAEPKDAWITGVRTKRIAWGRTRSSHRSRSKRPST